MSNHIPGEAHDPTVVRFSYVYIGSAPIGANGETAYTLYTSLIYSDLRAYKVETSVNIGTHCNYLL